MWSLLRFLFRLQKTSQRSKLFPHRTKNFDRFQVAFEIAWRRKAFAVHRYSAIRESRASVDDAGEDEVLVERDGDAGVRQALRDPRARLRAAFAEVLLRNPRFSEAMPFTAHTLPIEVVRSSDLNTAIALRCAFVGRVAFFDDLSRRDDHSSSCSAADYLRAPRTVRFDSALHDERGAHYPGVAVLVLLVLVHTCHCCCN